jgi:hypothetical protein
VCGQLWRRPPEYGRDLTLLSYVWAAMPQDHVLIDWAEKASHAQGHSLGRWEQAGDIATATCDRCSRMAIADFSREAADRDEEVRGDATSESCSASVGELR